MLDGQDLFLTGHLTEDHLTMQVQGHFRPGGTQGHNGHHLT